MRTVFFDLDGTLTDPQAGILRSIEHAFEVVGRPSPAPSVLVRWIGPSLRRTLVEFFDEEALADRTLAAYRERYTSVGFAEATVFPGVIDVLDAIRRAGKRAFVVTAKPKPYAVKVVEHFGLASHLDGVYGPGLDGSNEDKRDLLGLALRETRTEASSGWMVGDRAHDIVAAVANGVTGVGVTWGYGSAEELLEAGARVVCGDPQELLRAILR